MINDLIFIKNDTLVKRAIFRLVDICYIELFANVWIYNPALFCLIFGQNRTKHKKRKDSLETGIISSLEVEISGMFLQGIHQNIKKWLLPVNIF